MLSDGLCNIEAPSTRTTLKAQRKPGGEFVEPQAPEHNDTPGGQVSDGRAAQTAKCQNASELYLWDFDPEIAARFGQVFFGRTDSVFAGLVIAGIGLTAGLPALHLVIVKIDLRTCRVVLACDQGPQRHWKTA